MIHNFRNCIVMKFRICCFSVISFYSTRFLGVLRYYFDQYLVVMVSILIPCCTGVLPQHAVRCLQHPLHSSKNQWHAMRWISRRWCTCWKVFVLLLLPKKTREMDDSNMRVPKNIGLFHNFPPILIYFQQNVRRRQLWKHPQILNHGCRLCHLRIWRTGDQGWLGLNIHLSCETGEKQQISEIVLPDSRSTHLDWHLHSVIEI